MFDLCRKISPGTVKAVAVYSLDVRRPVLVSSSQAGKPQQEAAAILDAIGELLRPLMPLVLRAGLTAQDIGQVFRSLYLDTLTQKLKAQGRPATVARLALMAGLTRGEVERLRALGNERLQLRTRGIEKLGQLAALLALWHDDGRFSTPYGAPLDLSLQPEKGFRTFPEVVEAAAPGLDPSLVLDELLAAGCVEVHAGKFVRCINRVFIPVGSDVAGILRLGKQSRRLNATMAHNLLRESGDPSYYEREIVTGGGVREDFREAALQYLNTTVQQFIEQTDRWWESKEGEFTDKAGTRYGLGVFFYEEPRFQEVQPEQQIARSG